ncbi:MAG: thiolase family protein [Chloroflexi bacterium]|nr:thiolase family protein [Chloroflexota bacterium]
MEAVIIDGVRTPIGLGHPEKGWLRKVRGDDLGVVAVKALLERTSADPTVVEDVIFGCATQTGEQAMNVARYMALMAGLPYEVAGQTINRQCASGMTALHAAAQAIKAGCGDVFIAGGLESMSHLPEGTGADLNPRRFDFADPSAASMGLTAENLARAYGISRREQEEFALWSHRRAVATQREGRFRAEMAPVGAPQDSGAPQLVCRDQLPREDASLEVMAALPLITHEGGTITIATACRPGDGAAALLVMSAGKAREMGLRPLARIRAMAVAGVDPKLMGLGPVPAARKALARVGLQAQDIDLWEVNEAFAVVPLVFIKEMRIDSERLNVNGGVLALGHPMGCTGARMVVTLLHEMVRRQARLGLAALCVGMGQGVSTIIERYEGS